MQTMQQSYQYYATRWRLFAYHFSLTYEKKGRTLRIRISEGISVIQAIVQFAVVITPELAKQSSK